MLTVALIVTIRLSPLPNTPQLRQPRFKCSSNQRFEYIVRFLRKKLMVKDHESVFCYVNSVFAPGLDEGVGNLWRVSVHPSNIVNRDVAFRLSDGSVSRSSMLRSDDNHNGEEGSGQADIASYYSASRPEMIWSCRTVSRRHSDNLIMRRKNIFMMDVKSSRHEKPFYKQCVSGYRTSYLGARAGNACQTQDQTQKTEMQIHRSKTNLPT